MNKLKPILIHTHIYYLDKWEELKSIIHNFETYNTELYVTIVEENKHFTQEVLLAFPNAKVLIVENRGYDIAPFVEVINLVDLSCYSYVVKLHTKKDQAAWTELAPFDMSGAKWRNCLLEAFSSIKQIEQIISTLEHNKKITMHANHKLIVSKDKSSRVIKNFKAFLTQNNMPQCTFSFVAGTMFIAKAQIFTQLQKLGLSSNDFEVADSTKSDFSHAIERFLGYCVYTNEWTIQDVLTPKYVQMCEKFIATIKRFFYFDYNTNEKRIIKILSIPVYCKKK